MTLLAALLLAAPTALQAQPVPDAGSLQREAQRHLQAPRSSTPAPQAAPAAAPMPADAKAVRVTVRH
ncbi:MAG: ShlB/FhaC/HecB family hemolysin secretion/activation protein, partial [Comamonas sp.]|nr:ShlB/FhaC/HecB family hemolysin secretion/activation protein [Comamonas sp.]